MKPKAPKKKDIKPSAKSGEVVETRYNKLTLIELSSDYTIRLVIDGLIMNGYGLEFSKGSIAWCYVNEAKRRGIIINNSDKDK